MVTKVLKKNKPSKLFISILAFSAFSFTGKCQANDKPSLFIDFPLFEYPYNTNSSYKNLSME